MPIPALISGGLGLASGIVGGLLGSSSNKQTNSLNYKMFREQQQFTAKQAALERYYNSYQRQVQDMRAAGINPALQASGMASSASAQSSPAGSPMQSYDWSPALGQAVGSAAQMSEAMMALKTASVQNENTESLTALNEIDKISRSMMNLSKIGQMKSQTAYTKRLTRLAGLDIQLQEQTMGDKVLQQQWQSELLRAQAGAQLLANTWFPSQAEAGVKQALASAKAALDTGQASLWQAKNAADEIGAKYGVSESDRKEYSRAAFNYLTQQISESESKEFQNTYTPWSSSFGSKILGEVSHSTVQGHYSDYKRFRETKKRR